MSKFIVCSKTDCETICRNPLNDKNFAIISINNTTDAPANLTPSQQLKDTLVLHFDDVEKGDPYAITTEDADKIYDFAYGAFYNSDIDIIYIHCGAGVSRSAGVAAALMNIFENKNDSPIFDNPRYCPNMTCYRAILNACYGELTPLGREDKINHKEEVNIKRWKEIYKGEF